MKYVNRNMKSLLCVVAALGLVACGSQKVKTTAVAESTRLDLVASIEYIPQPQAATEAGKYLPYVPQENPYLTRARIDKVSVAAFIEARKSFKAKDYATAEKQLTALTQQDKSISGPWVMLGDIAMESKAHTVAEAHYRRALGINKNNINAWLRLAHVLRVEGRFLEAQNAYVDALQVWRDCPEAHLNLAVLYDVYLNLPLRAQRHMEAYLFLSKEPSTRVLAWFGDLQSRTNAVVSLPLKDGLPDQSLVVSK